MRSSKSSLQAMREIFQMAIDRVVVLNVIPLKIVPEAPLVMVSAQQNDHVRPQ
jgi:hypothetical protein